MKLSLMFAAMPIVFLAASVNAIAHADEAAAHAATGDSQPTPASPAHVMVSFQVGASTVKSAEHQVPGRVSYCAIDSRGNMTCGAPVTMGKVNAVSKGAVK